MLQHKSVEMALSCNLVELIDRCKVSRILLKSNHRWASDSQGDYSQILVVMIHSPQYRNH